MGRFFTNPEQLQQAGLRAHEAYKAAITSGDAATRSLASVEYSSAFASELANVVATRTLELTDKLEQRIAALEKSQFGYFGVFEEGKSYRKNSFLTDSGSLWIARKETAQRPGSNEDWKLAVKRGRDGKDSK